MKKFLHLIVFSLLLTSVAIAQGNYIHNQWWLQKPLFNPAASGVDGVLDAAIGSRIGASESEFGEGTLVYARVEGRWDSINSGFGFSYFNNNPEYLGERTGNYLMRQRFGFNYNYQITFKNTHILALGAAAEIIRDAWQIPSNPNDPTLPQPTGIGNDVNLGFGLYYAAPNWHVGLSLMPSINLSDSKNLASPDPSWFLSAAYNFLVADQFSVEPSLLLQSGRSAPLSEEEATWRGFLNLNVKAWYANAYYAGLGINTGGFNQPDSFDLLLGLRVLKGLSFHYTYVFILSDLSSINRNQNVVSLNYIIPSKT